MFPQTHHEAWPSLLSPSWSFSTAQTPTVPKCFLCSILFVPRFRSPQQGIDSDSLGNCYPVCMCAQSCPTLCNPMECSPPVSSVHGISQGRILEWVAISFSRISSQPRDQTQAISCIADGFFTTREVIVTLLGEKKNLF